MEIILHFSLLLLFTTSFSGHCRGNRVLELNDDFLINNNRKNLDSKWLIEFYTPWCHTCKQFEPDFMQVAQILHNYDLGVTVARIDCNKYPSVASHFQIKTYPTFKYVSGSKIVEFVSDRDRDELIDFVKRMAG